MLEKGTEGNMSKPLFIHPAIHLLIGYLLSIEFIKGICFTQIWRKRVRHNFEDSAGFI